MNIVDDFKKLFFYRQHPETALRYLPIVDLLRKNNWQSLKILEVGSGSYGITPYLKKKVMGVDTSFDEPEYPLLEQVKGSAAKIPFKDEEFDVVIMSDVLEHLPKEVREKSVKEAVRVAKKAVVISGPFGKEAFNQDQKLALYSKKKLGKVHYYLEEHLKYGLPEVRELNGWLAQDKRVKEVKVVGEYLNLGVRGWLMHFFIVKSKWEYYFYLKGLMPLVPIMLKMNSKPCYRSLVLVTL